jgi:hypothetical protein
MPFGCCSAELGKINDARRHIGEALATIKTTKETWCEARSMRSEGAAGAAANMSQVRK